MKYKDTGCEFSPSCQDCPFPACIYEYPGGKVAWLKKQRDLEIKRLFGEGKTTKELAVLFDVRQRTIQRVVRKSRGKSG